MSDTTAEESLSDSPDDSLAINAKGEPFPTEPLIMALLLTHH
jgi:hypothetical protein